MTISSESVGGGGGGRLYIVGNLKRDRESRGNGVGIGVGTGAISGSVSSGMMFCSFSAFSSFVFFICFRCCLSLCAPAMDKAVMHCVSMRLRTVEAMDERATIPISSLALFQNVLACSGSVSVKGGMILFSWWRYTDGGKG